jgi:hypothetical protein
MTVAAMFSRHLNEEALVDLAEGAGSAQASQHLASCPLCAEKLEGFRAGLVLASEAEVPEPSAIYWQAFRGQVQRRIAAEGTSPGWTRAWRWLPAAAVLVGLAAFPLVGHGPRHATPLRQAETLEAWVPLPAAEEDNGLLVLESLVVDQGTVTIVAADESPNEAVLGLSDEENDALGKLLRGRLREGSL